MGRFLQDVDSLIQAAVKRIPGFMGSVFEEVLTEALDSTNYCCAQSKTAVEKPPSPTPFDNKPYSLYCQG
jgi:hypothetical protein